jgi:hypothetical protein
MCQVKETKRLTTNTPETLYITTTCLSCNVKRYDCITKSVHSIAGSSYEPLSYKNLSSRKAGTEGPALRRQPASKVLDLAALRAGMFPKIMTPNPNSLH